MTIAFDQTADGLADRRTTILDAAERCFVQHGFHRTTMQDLARMAGMSVGNLYRYFPAKDAVVLALAERDRAEAARDICETDAALWPALVQLLRLHLIGKPREKAVLLLEVWAEGSRNPTIAAMLARFDRENRAWIRSALSSAGDLSDDETAEVADRIRTECQGILVNRALSADYDPGPEAERLIASIEERLAARGPLSILSQSRLEPVR